MIVHVTDCFHPRLGGIENQVHDLARAQQEAGETVQVITATPANGAAGRCDYGYPVRRVVAPLPWELPIHPRARVHLIRLFQRLQPDVVHVHLGSVSPFAWSAVSCTLRQGVPTVVTVHSLWGRGSQVTYQFLDRFSGWSHAPLVVTAVSSQCANLIMQTRPHLTVMAVPNGISPQIWQCPPDRMPVRAEDAIRIVAVGRLAPRKQPITLLKVLHAARRRIDPEVPLRVTVAGAGPALPLMRAYLRTHSMTEWVRLSGRLDRTGVHALLGTADLFINPTVLESFGIATLEARTAGVPVIARSGNGIGEFIRHGKEGLLCDSTDEIIEAITLLVQDGETRHRMREHNRTTEPTNCTWSVVTAAFAKCYDRAVTLTAPPPEHPKPEHPIG